MIQNQFEKINFKEKYPEYYTNETVEVTPVTTYELNYLTIKGVGHPDENKKFHKAIQLLEGLIFAIKFKLKNNPPAGFFDFWMPPSEVLWSNIQGDKKDRDREVMLPVPKFITEEKITMAWRIAQAKSEEKLPHVNFRKGKKKKVIQILHIGPYDEKKKKIEFLKKYASKNKLELKGNYQEVFLNDARRTKPEKLETILRYEVKPTK